MGNTDSNEAPSGKEEAIKGLRIARFSAAPCAKLLAKIKCL
jgi:hypothetical protein